MTDSSSCSPTTIQTYPEEIVCPLAKLGRLSPSCAAAFDNAYHHKLVSSVSNYHPRPPTASTLDLDYRQNCVRYCSASGATNRYGSQSAVQKYERARLSATREKAFSQNSLVSSSGCCGDSPVNFSSGKDSPCLDQGYHTLVVSGGAQPAAWTTSTISAATSAAVVASNKLRKSYNGNNGSGCGQQFNYFDKLTDALVIKILSFLSTNELCSVSSACRRFYNLAWDQSLWQTVCLRGDRICGDKAVKCVLRRLCSQQSSAGNVGIRQVYVYDGAKISDRGLTLLARRCPRLTLLHLQNCPQISDTSIAELATKCPELQHLDLTGCSLVSCINITPTLDSPKKLYLQYLDLTDCLSVQDDNLNVILRNCPQLTYLYLRRCIKITDNGVKFIPSFCSSLRELSVSDCNEVTDFALYELAKLGSNLRYLSVAKCSRVSDAGLKVIAKRCYKLRYLNVRGCEAVSDDAIMMLARSCPRLRALDIGKCDVSDAGLRAIAESCPNLKKLSLRNCDLVTDKGVQCISYYCRGLQQLNIQDCQISIEGYRAVKRYCKRCIIEHTNPGFF